MAGYDAGWARDGAVGGAAATVAMSAVMLAARGMGLVGQLPPHRIAQEALGGPGHRDTRVEVAVATTLHLLFGIASGMIYTLLSRRWSLGLPAVARGCLFGTALWAISYKGWVPALGILPPPERDRPDRTAVMVVAHWVYGGVLAALTRDAPRNRHSSGAVLVGRGRGPVSPSGGATPSAEVGQT